MIEAVRRPAHRSPLEDGVAKDCPQMPSRYTDEQCSEGNEESASLGRRSQCRASYDALGPVNPGAGVNA
jgi:hypothetical protein